MSCIAGGRALLLITWLLKTAIHDRMHIICTFQDMYSRTKHALSHKQAMLQLPPQLPPDAHLRTWCRQIPHRSTALPAACTILLPSLRAVVSCIQDSGLLPCSDESWADAREASGKTASCQQHGVETTPAMTCNLSLLLSLAKHAGKQRLTRASGIC